MAGLVGGDRLEEGADDRMLLPEIPAGPQFGEQEAFKDAVKAHDSRRGGTQRIGASEEIAESLRWTGTVGSDLPEQRTVADLLEPLTFEESPIALEVRSILQKGQEVDAAGFAVVQIRGQAGEEACFDGSEPLQLGPSTIGVLVHFRILKELID